MFFNRDGFGLSLVVDFAANPIDLFAFLQTLADARVKNVGEVEFADDAGFDRLASFREFVQGRDVEIAKNSELERARDGCGGHHE